jgi:hypothetical protein
MKRYDNDSDIDAAIEKSGHNYCEWCERDVELKEVKTRRFFGRTIYKCIECLAILR